MSNTKPEPYIRKRGVVMAFQFNFAGELETDAGIFKYRPGDWLIKTDDKMWVCEEDEFENLYEPFPDLQAELQRIRSERA